MQDRVPFVDAPQSTRSLEAQADDNLALAKALAKTEPLRARELCRKTMLLYKNNPRNTRVRLAFKLLNTLPQPDEDEID